MNSLEQDRLEELFLTLMELEEAKRPAILEAAYKESHELGLKLEEMVSQYNTFDSKVMERLSPNFFQDIVDGDESPPSQKGRRLNRLSSDTLTFNGNHSGSGLGLIQSTIDPEQVGSYKILRKIGEGGMGRVYLAEASRPKRQVALKIIANSQVNPARFKSEYETLAKMNHERIARLIDAGDTPDGETFFTMDYVDGKPLILFCRENQLDIEARLELFLQVCDGVQHAHQKAILHRDLKPSNILVSMEESGPSVKIIDFGLAKALDVSENELFHETQFGTIIGTPLYMSPEQLDRKNNHPDIRGDVYALGVLLYELLTDSHPLDLELIKNVPLDEGLRICREEVCDRPGERLSKALALADSKGNAQLELKKRISVVRGDLEWIAMTAMEKDLNRRYQTVSELIADLKHFLSDQPISARPPGLAYRARKFIKRNKLLVIGSTLTFTGLVFGLTLAIYSSIKTAQAQAQTQQTLKKLESINTFLYNMLAAPDPRNEGRDAKIVDLLRNVENQLASNQAGEELQASIRERLGVTYLGLGLFEEARVNLEIASRLQLKLLNPQDPNTFLSRSSLAYTLKQLGRPEVALNQLEAIYGDLAPTLGANHEHILRCRYFMALCYRELGKYSQAESYFREAFTGQQKILGEAHPDTIQSLVGLANSIYFQGRSQTAERYYKEALALQKQELGLQYPDTLRTMGNLGNCLVRLEKFNEASVILSEAVSACREVYGNEHKETIRVLYTWARCLNKLEQYGQANRVLTEVVNFRRKKYGPTHQSTLRAMHLQVVALGENGHITNAIALLQEMTELCRDHGLIQDPQYSKALNSLGHYLRINGSTAEAVLALEEALDIRFHQDAFSIDTLVTLSSLGEIYGSFDQKDALYFAEQVWFTTRELHPQSSYIIFFGAVYATCLAKKGRLEEARGLLDFYLPMACQQDAYIEQWEHVGGGSLLKTALD